LLSFDDSTFDFGERETKSNQTFDFSLEGSPPPITYHQPRDSFPSFHSPTGEESIRYFISKKRKKKKAMFLLLSISRKNELSNSQDAFEKAASNFYGFDFNLFIYLFILLKLFASISNSKIDISKK